MRYSYGTSPVPHFIWWGADGKGHIMYLVSGLPNTVLSEFRSRLVKGNAEQRLLDLLLERCREGGWLKAHGRQRTALGGSPRLGAHPRASRVGGALWPTARTRTLAESEEEERQQYANQVGTDGWMLLDALEAPDTPDPIENAACRHHPAHQMARTSLSQESKVDGGVQNLPCPRLSSSTPPMTRTHARAAKRTPVWVGYKVHCSQTCDEDAPQLITHVETTPAPFRDEGALSAIHTGLAGKELLPEQHLVDAGYVTIANLVQSQSSYGVDLVGPTLKTRLPSGRDRL